MATLLQAVFGSAIIGARSPTSACSFHRVAIPAQNVPQAFELPKCGELELFEVTVDELQGFMTDGQLTAEQYTRFCLERIRQVNDYLKAVIEVNPDAEHIARQCDIERGRGQIRSKLHGIPVLVKDNMATQDRMQTTAGSWALLGSIVPRDAHVVSKLRAAGAIIIGHANMSEWASCRSSAYSTGYSARGDQTRNPYDLTRSPRGSSSGSAVAVAANIVPIAFGTETDTSIVGPAMVAGIVGIKPTVGLTSRSGVIPISKNMDTVGPFARNVADATYALNVIVGKDDSDKATLLSERPEDADYGKSLISQGALKGAVFGLPIKRCWELVPESHKRVASAVFDAVKRCGAKIEPTDIPSWEDRIPEDGSWDWEHGPKEKSEYTVVKVDAYNGINSYLAELQNASVKTVEDIVQYNKANAGSEGGEKGVHPAFPSGQNGFEEIVAAQGREDETYERALRYTQTMCREKGIDGALRRGDASKQFDALIFCDSNGVGQQIAAQAGYPIISIPIGVDESGIPVSLTLQHSAWRESDLIRWASAIENVLRDGGVSRPLPKYHNASAKVIPIKS